MRGRIRLNLPQLSSVASYLSVYGSIYLIRRPWSTQIEFNRELMKVLPTPLRLCYSNRCTTNLLFCVSLLFSRNYANREWTSVLCCHRGQSSDALELKNAIKVHLGRANRPTEDFPLSFKYPANCIISLHRSKLK